MLKRSEEKDWFIGVYLHVVVKVWRIVVTTSWESKFVEVSHLLNAFRSSCVICMVYLHWACGPLRFANVGKSHDDTSKGCRLDFLFSTDLLGDALGFYSSKEDGDSFHCKHTSPFNWCGLQIVVCHNRGSMNNFDQSSTRLMGFIDQLLHIASKVQIWKIYARLFTNHSCNTFTAAYMSLSIVSFHSLIGHCHFQV